MLLIYVVHLLLVLKGHLNVCREQNSGKFCIVEQNSVLPDSCILVTARGLLCTIYRVMLSIAIVIKSIQNATEPIRAREQQQKMNYGRDAGSFFDCSFLVFSN